MTRTSTLLALLAPAVTACWIDAAPPPEHPVPVAAPGSPVRPTPTPVYAPPVAPDPAAPPVVVTPVPEPATGPTATTTVVVAPPPPPPAPTIVVQVHAPPTVPDVPAPPTPTVVAPGPAVPPPTPPIPVGPPRPTVIGRAPLQVVLANHTGRTVCALSLYPSGRTDLAGDLLGGSTMPPMSELAVTIDGSVAAWDLAAVDCAGNLVADERGRAFPSDGVWSVRGVVAGTLPPVAPVVPGPPRPTVVGATGPYAGIAGPPIALADFRNPRRLAALAVAYWLGVGREDLDELRRAALGQGACGFIDHPDLDDMCSIAIDDLGACSFLDDDDLVRLCEVGFEREGSCGLIRDTDLQYFCRSAFEGEPLCDYIARPEMRQVCWGLY